MSLKRGANTGETIGECERGYLLNDMWIGDFQFTTVNANWGGEGFEGTINHYMDLGWIYVGRGEHNYLILARPRNRF